MQAPEQPDQVSLERMATLADLRRINVAMVCYAILGVSATVLGTVMTFCEKETQAAWGFFLFANLSLPVVAAFVVSIIYTALARRYRPLLGLCVLHILFLAAIVLVMSSQSADGASEIPVDVAILSYGAFFIAVSVWWFAVGKRRIIQAKS